MTPDSFSNRRNRSPLGLGVTVADSIAANRKQGRESREDVESRYRQEAEHELSDLRKRSEEAHKEAKILANTDQERHFRAAGAKFFKADDGNYYQDKDEQGRLLYSESPWELRDFGDTKREVRRNRFGKAEIRLPDLKAGDSPEDPYLYYSDGAKAGHVDDIAMNGPDTWKATASKVRDQRRKALVDNVEQIFDRRIAEHEVNIATARGEGDRLGEERLRIATEIAEIEANPMWGKKDGFGPWSKQTPEAAQLSARYEALNKQVSGIDAKIIGIETKTGSDGELYRSLQAAKSEKDLWKNYSELDKFEDLEQQRLAILKANKSSAAEIEQDSILKQIRSDKERYGVHTSQIARQRESDMQLVADAKARAKTPLTANSSPEEFDAEANALADSIENFETERSRIEQAISSGALKGAAAIDARNQIIRQAAEIEELGSQFNAAIGQANEANIDAHLELLMGAISAGEQLGWIDGKWFSRDDKGYNIFEQSQQRQTRVINRVESEKYQREKSGETSKLKDLQGGLSIIGQVGAELFNVIKGSDDKTVADRANYAEAIQIVGDLRGDEARRALISYQESIQKLSKGADLVKPDQVDWKQWVTESSSKNRLGKMQYLVNELRKGNLNPVQAGTESFGESFGSLFNLVGYDWTLRGIDKDDADQLGKFNALRFEAMRLLNEEYPNSSLAGQVVSSLSQFMLTRSIGNKVAGATTGAIGSTSGLARLSNVGSKYGLTTARAGAGLGYGMMGYSMSKSENPYSMGVLDRAASTIGNAAVLAVAESAGNKLEGRFNRVVGAKPTVANFLSRQATGTFGAFMGENLSEVIEAWARGENPADQMEAILKGNLGAVVGMRILGARGALRTLKAYQAMERQHTGDLAEMVDRMGDLNNLILQSKNTTTEGAQARKALEVVGGEAPIERLNELVVTLEGKPKKASLEEQIEWLGRDNAKALTLSQTAEILQKKALATYRAIGEIEASTNTETEIAGLDGDMATAQAASGSRTAAIAMLKIANNNQNLTTAEGAALSVVENEIGTSILRPVGEYVVVTDGARDWLTTRAPSSTALLPRTEGEQIADIEAHTRRNEQSSDVSLGAENPTTNPQAEASSGISETGFAQVRYLDGDGQEQQAGISEDAKLSYGQSVNADNVADYLAEQGESVRRINSFAQAKKRGRQEPTIQAVEGSIKPGMLLRGFQGKSNLNKGQQAAASRELAKRINNTLSAWGNVFQGVEMVEGTTSGGGGFEVSMDGKLRINLSDLIDPDNLPVLLSKPERINKLIEEEAIHAAALKSLEPAQVRAVWDALPDSGKKVVRKTYGSLSRGDDQAFVYGHEFLRMVVQGKLAVQGDRIELDGVLISEDTSGSGLLQQILDALTQVRDYILDTAGTMRKAGASDTDIALVESAVSRVQEILNSLRGDIQSDGEPNTDQGSPDTDLRQTDERIGGRDRDTKLPESKSDSTPSQSDRDAAPIRELVGRDGDTDTYRLQDGTRIEYQYRLVEESEVLEDPRNTKPGMESFETRKFVEARSGNNFDPQRAFAIDPTFQQGPPMVENEKGSLIIKGGHRRTFIRRNNRESYESALPKYLSRFGIDPKAAGGMDSPVVVAVINKPLNAAQRDSLISQLNESDQQGTTTAWRATAIARKMTPDLVRTAGTLFQRHPDRTPLDVLQSADSGEFSDALVARGVLSDAEAKQFVNENGSFTKYDQGGGAALMKKVLLATVIDDSRTLDRIEGTSLETKSLNAIGPMVTLFDRGQDARVVQRAIAMEAERLQMAPVPSVGDFQAQSDLGFGEDKSPESEAIQRWLAGFNSKDSREQFNQLIADFLPNEDPNQVGLFGEENQDVGEGLLARERGSSAVEIEEAVLSARRADIQERAQSSLDEIERKMRGIFDEYRMPEVEKPEKLTMKMVEDRYGKTSTRRALRLISETYIRHRDATSRFERALTGIVEKVGGKIKKPGVKGVPRTVEKFIISENKWAKRYDGNAVVGLRDLLRDTIEVPDITSLYRALNELYDTYGFVDSEDRMLGGVMPGGYHDYQMIMQVRWNVFAELQANTPEMLDAKKIAHVYYENIRSGRGTEADMIAQEKIYGAAFSVMLTRDVATHGQKAAAVDTYTRATLLSSRNALLNATVLAASASSAETSVSNGHSLAGGQMKGKGSSNISNPPVLGTNVIPNALSSGVPGGMAYNSPLENPNLVPAGNVLANSDAFLIHDNNTRVSTNRQRTISRAAKAVQAEKRGKPQMRSLAKYDGKLDFVKVVLPAKRSGLKRSQMPQINSAHKADFVNWLRESGISVDKVNLLPSQVTPSQMEMDGVQILKMADNFDEVGLAANPALLSSDDFVADGHHRWGAYLIRESRKQTVPMPFYRVNLPLDELHLAMEDYGKIANIPRRGLKDHNYQTLRSRRGKDDAQMGLFDMLGDQQEAAKEYVAKTPTRVKKSKSAFRKQAEKDIPTVAVNDAMLGDLFAYAESQLTDEGNQRTSKPKESYERKERSLRDASQTGRDRDGQKTPGSSREGAGVDHQSQFNAGSTDSAGQRGSIRNDESREPSGQDVAGNAKGSTGSAHSDSRESRVRVDRVVSRKQSRYVSDDLAPADRDFVIDGEVGDLAPRGNVAKYRANLAAIRLLRKLESENRNATPDEKSILARYAGWGWAGEYFNESNTRYSEQYEELSELLTDEEFRSASRSTLNAHYTAPEVIAPMWDAVRRMGFSGGRVMEPAGGIGHFFGMMPKDLRSESQLHGVELDSLSARLFTMLYPNASIKAQGFEKSNILNNSIDLAIGNVPFGGFKLVGDDYQNLLIHDYFFARSLDKVKPGGIVAFVTSDGTMNKLDSSVRNLLDSKADLVGAIRLPNNAFKGNAGTEVTTDIIFLRKKDGTAFDGKPWLQVRKIGEQEVEGKMEPIYVNEYFADNPDMALGRHALEGSMYGAGDYALVGDGRDMSEALSKAVNSLPQNISSTQTTDTESKPDEDFADDGEREGASYLNGERGEFYQIVDGKKVKPEWYSKKNFGDEDSAEKPISDTIRKQRKLVATDWLKVRDVAVDLLRLEGDPNANDAQITAQRMRLNAVYDRYVKRHGTFTKRYRFMEKAAFLEDHPDYSLLQALENEKSYVAESKWTKAQLAKGAKGRRFVTKYEYFKADIFTERVRQPASMPDKAENATDAVAISRSFYGGIRPDVVARLLGTTEAEAMEQAAAERRVFKDPRSGLYEFSENYLSGNVRQKLKDAEAAMRQGQSEYSRNVEALKTVIPNDVEAARISATMSSRWIDEPIFKAFFESYLGTAAEISYSKAMNRYNVSFASTAQASLKYKTERVTAKQVIRAAMDGTDLTVFDTVPGDTPGKPKRIKNVKETNIANKKVAQLNRDFQSWLRTTDVIHENSDGKKQAIIEYTERRYNDINNSVVPPTITGEYLTLPGSTKEVYKLPHRMAVVARILSEGCCMMAHGVGSGKTFSQIVASYEMKRLGMAQKPMIVVQNATIGQFASSYKRAYPQARVLVAGDKDLSKHRRLRFLNRVGTGNWDAVILTQSQFNTIRNSDEAVEKYFNGQMDELRAEIRTAKLQAGKKDATTKQMEKELESLRGRMDQMLGAQSKREDGNVLNFEELGVDALFVDEAHEYKKIPIVTKKKNLKGVPNDQSLRAINLELKVRQIQEKKNGRNVILATGTPITNSMAEAYVMLRLATPHVLKAYRIENFDYFANTFGRSETKVERTWRGTYLPVTRFSQFINLPELTAMIRSGFDVKMGNKELGLKVPEYEGGKPEAVVVKPTAATEAISDWVLDIANAYDQMEPIDKKENSWVPIVTMGAGMAGALDPRLLDTNAPDDPQSKVNTAVRNILDIYRDDSQGVEKKTQMVFADQFLPVNTSRLEGIAGGVNHEADEDSGDSEAEDNSEEAMAKAEMDAFAGSKGFNLYHDIKAKLIAGGIPEKEIAIIHEYKTDRARVELFDKMNSGEVRILIGSTLKMGVGVNAQAKLYAMHHLDPPRQMTPAMLEQRIGRIIRQGNSNETVREFRYVVEKSMDAGIYEILERKALFIRDALMGRAEGREMRDEASELAMSIADIKARATGDSRIIRRVEITADLMELEDERDAFQIELSNAARGAANIKSNLGARRLELQSLRSNTEWFQKNIPDNGISMQVNGGTVHEKRKDGLSELNKAVARAYSELGMDDNPYATREIPIIWNGLRVKVVVSSQFNNSERTLALEGKIYNPLQADMLLSYASGTNANGLLMSLSQFANSMKDGSQANSVESFIASQEAKLPMYEQASKKTWEHEKRYQELRTELDRIDTELVSEQSSKQPDTLKSRRAALLDGNQSEIDFEAQPESINRTDLITDNLPLATFIANRFRLHRRDMDFADLLQDARLALVNAARTFDPRVGEFGAYASRVIRNRLIDKYRRPDLSMDSLDEPISDVDGGKIGRYDKMADNKITLPSDRTERADRYRYVRDSIKQLPESMQKLVYARMDGQTYEEIGNSLGISKQAAAKRFENASNALKGILGEELRSRSAGGNLEFDPENVDTTPSTSTNNQPPTDQLQQIAFLEDWAAARGKDLSELIDDVDAFNEAASRWRKAHPDKRGIDRAASSRMAGTDADAIAEMMRILNSEAPDSSDSFDKALGEVAGEQEIGRPDLSNPAEGEMNRRFVDSVDEQRKEQMERQSHEQWEKDARSMLQSDREGVKRRLLEVAQDPRYNGLTDAVDVKAAQMLVAQIIEEAVIRGDSELMREAQILTYAYRESGTETARAMAARRDPHKTPAERHKEFLASAIFRPSRKASKDIQQAPSAAEKSRMMDKARTELRRYQDSDGAKHDELIRLRKALKAIKDTPTKTDILNRESEGRLKKIEQALFDMGVTLEDIFSGETELRLRGTAIVDNYTKQLDDSRSQAVSMLHRGDSVEAIRRVTKLSMGDMNDIVADFQKEFLAKHLGKFKRGLKAKDVDVMLKSAPGDIVSDTEAMAEAMRALEMMGFGKNWQKKNARRQKRKGRSNKPTVVKSQSIPGLEYEWEVDSPKPGDRNYQRPAQPDLGQGTEPPAFDISDPIEVARTMRIIESAADNNGFDMVYEWWINSILSGPQTHIANIAGNTLNAALDMTIQRGTEAAINGILTKIGQGDPDAPQLAEFKYMLRGVMPGIMDGYRAAVEAWGSETSLFKHRVLDEQIEMGGMGRLENYKVAIPGKAGRIVRIPGRGLLFMDEFFKGLLARTQVGAEAYRIAKGEGLTSEALERRITGLVNRVGSVAWERAANKAIELTFQADYDTESVSGRIMKGVTQFRNDTPGMRYVVPFLRTIYNIFAIGIRKSPVGVFNMATRIASGSLYRIKDGKPFVKSYPRPEFIRHAAEQVLAFGATALLYGAIEGDDDDEDKSFLITGSRPMQTTKYGVSQLGNRTGMGAYTIRLGDIMFNYGRYEPISTVLGVTADTVRTTKQGTGIDATETFGNIAGSISENITSKTFSRGLSDLFGMIQEPASGVNWVSNFAASFVPNILRQPIRVMDPNVRETSMEAAWKDLPGRFAERTMESAIPIPSLRPVEIDVWGNEVSKEGNAISRLVIPQRAGAKPLVNRIDRMLINWNQSNPSDTYAPQTPSRSFEHDGERITMDDEEFIQYQKMRGQTAFRLLSAVPLNISQPTEQDLDRVRRALTAGHKKAKSEILLQRSLRANQSS